MGCEAGRCKTSTPKGIFIMTPSLEGRPTEAKEAPCPHQVRLNPLDTNPVFQCLTEKILGQLKYWLGLVNTGFDWLILIRIS